MGNFNQGSRFSGGGNRRFGGGGGGGGYRGNNSRGGSSFGRRDGERPAMHQAVCDECGKDCEVPFRPTGDKPIYCSDCFKYRKVEEDRPQRNDDRGFNRNFEEKEMFSAVCDECGKKCEVPFKPTSGKPVFCSDCFSKNNEGRNSRGNGSSNGNNNSQLLEQFQFLNQKLDKIFNLLQPKGTKTPIAVKAVAESKKTPVAKKAEVKKTPVKKVAAVKSEVKAPVKKKAVAKKAVVKKTAVKKVAAKKK
ncbi:MAG: CxxC-x17-CxxC domain-containing protein [bacterium]